MTIQQRNEINNMNQEKSKDEENIKDERNEDNCVNTRIKHDEYIICMKRYHRS